MRVFDSGRKAALAAAAGDDDGILRHASAAIAAYRGELLPGMYDDWLLDARAQLERQCVDLCDLACAARAPAGDLAGAVQAARRRVQLQPLEEIGYHTLMEPDGLGPRRWQTRSSPGVATAQPHGEV